MSEELIADELVVDEYIEPEGYYTSNGEEVINPDLEKGFRYGDILNGKLVWIYEPYDEERLEQIQKEKIETQFLEELPLFLENYNKMCEQLLMQEKVIADQDTAVCELYEMFMGL
jgi:hypothetical protein